MKINENEFPIAFQMFLTALPVAGIFAMSIGIALGANIDPFAFVPVSMLSARVIAQVLGLECLPLAIPWFPRAENKPA